MITPKQIDAASKVHYEGLTMEMVEKTMLEVFESAKKKVPKILMYCKTKNDYINPIFDDLCDDPTCRSCNNILEHLKSMKK